MGDIKMTNDNLSEKICIGENTNNFVEVQDVREFVRRLKKTRISLQKYGLSYEDEVIPWRS